MGASLFQIEKMSNRRAFARSCRAWKTDVVDVQQIFLWICSCKCSRPDTTTKKRSPQINYRQRFRASVGKHRLDAAIAVEQRTKLQWRLDTHQTTFCQICCSVVCVPTNRFKA